MKDVLSHKRHPLNEIDFSVGAPCLKEGLHLMEVMSLARAESCETAEGRQTFTAPSDTEPFRTPPAAGSFLGAYDRT